MPGRQVHFTFDTEATDDRYDLNQLRTGQWISNQDERRVIKMSWSIVSKAAEKSSRQRHDTWRGVVVSGVRRMNEVNASRARAGIPSRYVTSQLGQLQDRLIEYQLRLG